MSFAQIIFCWVWIMGINTLYAQTNEGMYIATPNPNAVLELVSEKINQGFLVPRFTTSQCIAFGFMEKLTSKNNGLLVFDPDEGQFYY